MFLPGHPAHRPWNKCSCKEGTVYSLRWAYVNVHIWTNKCNFKILEYVKSQVLCLTNICETHVCVCIVSGSHPYTPFLIFHPCFTFLHYTYHLKSKYFFIILHQNISSSRVGTFAFYSCHISRAQNNTWYIVNTQFKKWINVSQSTITSTTGLTSQRCMKLNSIRKSN